MKARQLRIRNLSWLLAFGLALIVLRLVQMQGLQGRAFLEQAQQNMVVELPISPPRGVIFDREGRVLARNVARFTISLVPSELKAPVKALESVAALLRLGPKRTRELVARMAERPGEPVVLKEALDEASLARVAEVQGEFPGIHLEVHPLRAYPLGAIAGHVLGQVGEVDAAALSKPEGSGYFPGEWVGKDGLERFHERLLHGRAGSRRVQVDANGSLVKVLQERAPRPGQDLHLSLDAYLQRVAEEALSETLRRLQDRNGEPSAGAVVALDPSTGGVRVLASLPSYNPNWFARGLSPGRFEKLLGDPRAPLVNRAIGSAFPPGSVFKLITSSAAMTEGLAEARSVDVCTGRYMVGDMPFHCFVRAGHGPVDLVDSLSKSCDVTYYRLGTLLGLERIARYSRAFGLGGRTGIDLPGEVAGNLPTVGWKEEVIGEAWYAGDSANLAIGQGFLSVTPLQMAVVTAAVVNGGRVVRPRLVESAGPPQALPRREPSRRVPVAARHLAVVGRGMREAVRIGTAAGAGGPDLEMAGKTGTVENSSTPDNPRGRNHTWFTSYSPASAPDLVVTVFLEKSGGYGGGLAAPVAAEVHRAWRALKSPGPAGRVAPVEDWERPGSQPPAP